MADRDQIVRYGKSPLTPTSASQPLYTYLFGGGHISHSLSPMINSILYKSAGVSWIYALCETTSPQRFLETLHQPDCIGASVTMPNKVTFMPLLDDLTEEAQSIGAVNVVFIRLDQQGHRRYIGTNTDCIGVRDTLLNHSLSLVEKSENQPALVVGAGGASRSAIYALWRWFRLSEIYLVNRLKSEVDALISSVSKTMPGILLRHIASVDDARAAPTPRIIVGTVPDGVPQTPGEIVAWQICEAFLKNGHGKGSGGGGGGAIVDMCYFPARTRLLNLAEANGWTTMLGSEVLVRVAAAQQRLWLELEPTPEGVDEALRSVRQASAAKI
ncbi:hypothetical protein LTR41_006240 [Exophiala xenobiotica]|nr:hypothetical protein LTR41_006240 [Exophiala xenobiotica]